MIIATFDPSCVESVHRGDLECLGVGPAALSREGRPPVGLAPALAVALDEALEGVGASSGGAGAAAIALPVGPKKTT